MSTITPETLALAVQKTVTALDQFNELTLALGVSLQEVNVLLNTPAAPQAPAFTPPPAPPGFTPPPAPAFQPPAPQPGLAFQPPPAPPSAPAAPVASEAAKPARKRRTKAEIAADEAALAAGLPLPATAGNVGTPGAPAAPAGYTAPPAPVPAPALAPAPAAVQPVQSVQPLAVPPGNFTPSAEDLVAKFQEMIAKVETVWPGHGAGQAGLLVNKVVPHQPNVHLMIPEERNQMHQWIVYFLQKFGANELPQGVATPGF